MNAFFEIIQSIEAIGIILFSLVSTYYGTKILILHLSEHGKLLLCCWLTIMQTFSQFIFFVMYIFILSEIIRGVVRDPTGFGATFVRPAVLINNAVIAVYLKVRYINEKNKKGMGEIKNG